MVDANSIAYLNELSYLHEHERPARLGDVAELHYTEEQSVAEFSSASEIEENERTRKKE